MCDQMENLDKDKLLNGAITALIDENNQSNGYFKLKLISNNSTDKVLNFIKNELRDCDEFFISVAFITIGGLTPLLQELFDLKQKGIKGKILTTDYLNFTEPVALKKLNAMSNIEVRLYPQEEEGFHTKAYIFKKGNIYKSIVGSSNITLKALTINKEWNVEFPSLSQGEFPNKILTEFFEFWNDANDLSKVLDIYEKVYNSNKKFSYIRKISREIRENESSKKLIPNSMQKAFLKKINKLIDTGENKALLISATGTGKTHASAFAVKEYNPSKFLFLVHREQIAKQSINTYKKVFKGENNKFGLLSGNFKDKDADYLFSTIQTFSKEDVYKSYSAEEFDYIVIDEVHRVGAFSYQKIMNYFNPKFFLGMTASPERSDDFDIYNMFDHNIAYEIRLKEALEEDLLCPFHYFGISDIEIDGKISEDNLSDFNYLTSKKRIDYLIEKSEYYGHSGERIKALVFCSRKEECKKLSKEFNNRGYSTIALSGEDSQKMRKDAIKRLTTDKKENKLDYIFTVDIFNEGVDIPEINQILLIRPTQSPIIFIQQLGRGLRKFKNKEYLVVLDFIGNYKNNFMIPLALSGDRSYDKDFIRRNLIEGNEIIPGSSSINFDKISKEKIFASINNTSFSKKTFFKEKYFNLKFKIGKIPKLTDFYTNGDLDPLLILNHKSIDNYHSFLDYADKEYKGKLSDAENRTLKFLSKWLANGKRPHELLILQSLIFKKSFNIKMIEKKLLADYNIVNDLKSVFSAINFLQLNFIKDNEKKKYGDILFLNNSNLIKTENIDKNDNIHISENFNKMLSDDTFNHHVNDLINYSLLKFNEEYCDIIDESNLSLYSKYSRKDVCRILNWESDDSSTVYGYRIKHNTCPLFVTYDKNESISNSTKYQDEFENNEIFSWMTRPKITLESSEVKKIINYKSSDLKIYLFIKKSDDEGSEFYYIGLIKPLKQYQTTILNDNGENLPIINFKYKLITPVRKDIYDYLIS